ncbi:hypothetical protein VPNG_02075 [Cytospora leucostoma]|uniref:Uncharacterized protein n=1 Tax=Cytospora leucostoma TaxID=1230097 RepID=A0A423XHF5_9PEZI|nr:hypothetical protein VPNG_02075 [Cytospora leucostoma]
MQLRSMDPFVSREWTAPATTSNDTGWDRRPNSNPSKPRRRRHGGLRYDPGRKGPSSLLDMAARVAAVNIHTFDTSYLDDLAPRALQAVLNQLTKRPDSMSLSAWKCAWQIIHQLQSPEPPMTLALQRFHQQFELPTAPLSVYLNPLQSGSFTFISHLKISGSCLVKSTELLQLPSLVKNIGILEIIEPDNPAITFPHPSDRMIKAWSQQDDPFPKLKVLKIHTRGHVTEDCLQYVTRFPALALFNVLGMEDDWQRADALADDYGWIYVGWSQSPSCRPGSGRAYNPIGARLTSLRSWFGLTHRIGTKSKTTYADAGVAGYETYTQLEQPALTALQGGFKLDDTHLPPLPFVSLTLGYDKRTIGAFWTTPRDMQTMFFWRYWQYGTSEPPQARFAPFENAVSMPPPRLKERRGLEKEKRKQRPPSGTFMRPRKRSRVGSVGDALSQLQAGLLHKVGPIAAAEQKMNPGCKWAQRGIEWNMASDERKAATTFSNYKAQMLGLASFPGGSRHGREDRLQELQDENYSIVLKRGNIGYMHNT